MCGVLSRRGFIALAALAAGAAACDQAGRVLSGLPGVGGDGRLTAQPPSRVPNEIRPGTRPLGITAERDAILSIPRVALDGPVPLVVSLHGAGGGRTEGLGRFRASVREGSALLVPHSRGPTWDLAYGGFGQDVEMIDRALAETFRRVAVDPSRIALAGFSDGASYALSLGLTNGDLFPFVIACSPGFFEPGDLRRHPEVFVSHGTDDRVLPFTHTRDDIIPELRGLGYDVRFVTFDGRHKVPPEIAREAIDWFIRSSG